MPPNASMNHLKSTFENLQPWHSKQSEPEDRRDVVTSIQELVDKIPLVVKDRKDKDIAPGSENDPIIELFRQTQLAPDQWSRYALFDSTRSYTRNLIATDDETYVLLLLCWNPQHESLIHDHPCDGCWLKVIQGTIRECRYSEDMKCISDQTFGEGEIAYITDNMGYHKIGNPTADQSAISLHLYAPPIQQCRIWRHTDKETDANDNGMICQQCNPTVYSKYGFRVP